MEDKKLEELNVLELKGVLFGFNEQIQELQRQGQVVVAEIQKQLKANEEKNEQIHKSQRK